MTTPLVGATLSTVRRRVTLLVGSNVAISTTEINDIISAEHITILGDNSWIERKAQGTIATVPVYTTGTVSTVGTAVTGVGTVFTAAMVNRWLRVGLYTEFYLITAVTDATHLTIETAIPGGDVSGQAFTIFQNVYPLPTDCQRVVSMVYQNEILDTPYQDINRLDPYRMMTGSIPTHYCYREMLSGARQVEIWPVPTVGRLLRMMYLKTNDLSDDTTSPLYRSDVLVWKAAASAAFLLYAKAGDVAWRDLATAYLDQYDKTLAGARLDDLGRNSPAHKIRNILNDNWPYGSGWVIDRDTMPWVG